MVKIIKEEYKDKPKLQPVYDKLIYDRNITMTDKIEGYLMDKSDKKYLAACRQATFELQAGRAGYKALWQHIVNVSIADLKQDYTALNVSFDLWLGESDSNQYLS